LVRTVQESAQHQTRNGSFSFFLSSYQDIFFKSFNFNNLGELNIDKDVAPVVESDGKTVITSIPISESEGSGLISYYKFLTLAILIFLFSFF